MPTYDYECAACANRMEAFQSMSDLPLKKCPKCGKRRLKRLIGAGAGVIFKGSGFYSTDYRSSAYATSKKGDVESPAPATKTETKTDAGAKPAPATDGGQSSPPPAPAKKSPTKK